MKKNPKEALTQSDMEKNNLKAKKMQNKKGDSSVTL